MFFIFLQSLVIGLSIAMPIGPIATLCIKNSLNHGWKIGFATGLGASLADSSYGFITGGGFVFIGQFLNAYLLEIKLIGGLILLFLGLAEIKNFRHNRTKEIKMKQRGFFQTAFFTFMLTLTNPMTIIFFAGVFATIGGGHLNATGTAITVLGIFCGSLAWMIFLSGITAKIRHKLPQKWMARLKLISGLMISTFGIYGITSTL